MIAPCAISSSALHWSCRRSTYALYIHMGRWPSRQQHGAPNSNTTAMPPLFAARFKATAENLFCHKQRKNPGLKSTLRWLCSSKFMSICLSLEKSQKDASVCFLPANDRCSICHFHLMTVQAFWSFGIRYWMHKVINISEDFLTVFVENQQSPWNGKRDHVYISLKTHTYRHTHNSSEKIQFHSRHWTYSQRCDSKPQRKPATFSTWTHSKVSELTPSKSLDRRFANRFATAKAVVTSPKRHEKTS